MQGGILMNKRLRNRIKHIKIVYLLCLLGMLFIVIGIHITRENCKPIYNTDGYQNINNDWTLDPEGQSSVNLNELGKYMNEDTGVLSIYYRIPEMNMDTNLVYRTKDVYSRLLIDDKVIYEPNVSTSPFYNRSPGNLWNIATISSKHAGKILEMQIIMVYDTKAITMDNTFWGDRMNTILSFVNSKMNAILVSVLMIMIGLALMILNFIPTYSKIENTHSLLFLGIYALLIGIWSLIETNVLQFFLSDSRILQLINNAIMITDSLPLILYLDCEYKILKYRFIRWFCYLDIAYMILCIVMQCTGIRDFHDLLDGATFAIFVCSFIVFAWILYSYITFRQTEKRALQGIQLIGIVALWLSTLLSTIRFSNRDTMDRAESIRLGMLLFIICFSISSQLHTYKLIKQGLQYDIISSLAYSDGLTGTANRTAYLEELQRYPTSDITQLGIVFLDINNLKTINDNQGHDMGDTLIKLAANVITGSFGIHGKVYRIGGDEFCVLIDGSNVQQIYETAEKQFNELITRTNEHNSCHLTIQIAHGFAICKDLTQKGIEEAISLADNAMYENKMQLKSGNKG